MTRSGDSYVWSWQWREVLSKMEVQQISDLKVVLTRYVLHSENSYRWRWVPATDGFFSVKSSYNVLLQSHNSIVLDPNVLMAIQKL
jgi:hypothetical protein